MEKIRCHDLAGLIAISQTVKDLDLYNPETEFTPLI